MTSWIGVAAMTSSASLVLAKLVLAKLEDEHGPTFEMLNPLPCGLLLTATESTPGQ